MLPFEMGEEKWARDRIVYGLAMNNQYCFVIYNMILLNLPIFLLLLFSHPPPLNTAYYGCYECQGSTIYDAYFFMAHNNQSIINFIALI